MKTLQPTENCADGRQDLECSLEPLVEPPQNRWPRILRLLIEIPESEAPFQQFSLPKMEQHDITLCTIFKSVSEVPPQMRLFEGDHTVRGYLRVLRDALKAGPYDIVHAHAPHVAFLYLLMAIRRPSLLRGTVMTVHNCYDHTKLRNKLLLIPTFALFRRIVCCGQASHDSYPKYLRWLAGRRFGVVVNGVDTARIDRVLDDHDTTSTKSNFTIASVCRLVPVKNLPTALKAFEKSEDRENRLVFMGDGEVRQPLIEQARNAGIHQRVDFPGMVPREEVYRQVASSDLFISASHSEGLPIAVLEAMACGCPVLLSDIEPHREIARGTDVIPLVAPDDVEGFTREINRFRNMSPEERSEIGRQCCRIVHERFSLQSMLKGYDQVFEDLATRPS